MNESTGKSIAVIGVGNLLYGDDAAGVHAARALSGAALPAAVEVIEGGALGLDLLDFLTGYETVVVMDAADMGLTAGEVRVFRPEEVRSLKTGEALSLHSTDILGVIELGKTLDEDMAAVYVVAVQVESVGPREGLSAPVAAAVEKMTEAAKGIVEGL